MSQMNTAVVRSQRSIQCKRRRSLERGKAASLNFFEALAMKRDGTMDGQKGLLRQTEDGTWQSSKLRELTDACEEYCSRLFGHLKLEEETTFQALGTLLDKVAPMQAALSQAKASLQAEQAKPFSPTERKVGEENLTEAQVIARRRAEREKRLQPFHQSVEAKTKTVEDTLNTIFSGISHLKESFDSTCKIQDRVTQHCLQKIDVYWRAAMQHLDSLPPVPEIGFTNQALADYRTHLEALTCRAEKLQQEFTQN